MSKYRVSVDVDVLPRGEPIEVPPVGVVANGSSVTRELDDSVVKLLGTAINVEVEKVVEKVEPRGGEKKS